MSTLYIAEYPDHSYEDEPPVAEQVIVFGDKSKVSKPFGPRTRWVRLHTDAPCSIRIGNDQELTATITNQRLGPNETCRKGVPVGHGFRLAVIANS